MPWRYVLRTAPEWLPEGNVRFVWKFVHVYCVFARISVIYAGPAEFYTLVEELSNVGYELGEAECLHTRPAIRPSVNL